MPNKLIVRRGISKGGLILLSRGANLMPYFSAGHINDFETMPSCLQTIFDIFIAKEIGGIKKPKFVN